jgi:hypothetical protein
MASFAIPVSWYNFVDYYPLVTKTTEATKGGSQTIVKLRDPRGSLNGELDGWATGLFNENPNYTTCCMQMSHAINMAFVTRDVSKLVGPNSVRPLPNHKATIARASNKEFYYLASVDEIRGSSTGLSSRDGRFGAAQTSRISRESSCSWALPRGASIRRYGRATTSTKPS